MRLTRQQLLTLAASLLNIGSMTREEDRYVSRLHRTLELGGEIEEKDSERLQRIADERL